MPRRVLLCTAVWWGRCDAENHRLQRMRQALHAQGIETVITALHAEPGGREADWSAESDACGAVVRYRLHPGRWVYPSPAMRRVYGAARFHREHGGALIEQFACAAVLVYADQAPLPNACLALARRHKRPILVDAAEYHRLSVHYLLNGVNLQQWRFRHRVVPSIDGLIGVGRGWCAWAQALNVPTAWVPAFGVEPERTRSHVAPADAPVRLVFLGHWVGRECPETLIAGLELAIQAGVDLHIDVLGKPHGSYRERAGLRALAAAPGVQARLRFHGFVSNAERDAMLADADLFVLLRRPDRETEHLFPTRLPEYLASGNPVILTATPTFAACFQHRQTAWLLDAPATPAAVSEAVQALASDPRLRVDIGAAGRELAQELFGVERLGDRLRQVIAEADALNSRRISLHNRTKA